MPSEPAQETIDLMEPYFDGAGVPPELTQSVWAALDAAGLTVVTKDAGTPVAAANDSTSSELVRVDGVRGVFLRGIKVGDRGWMVCVETYDDRGQVTRSPWSFAAGDGDLMELAG